MKQDHSQEEIGKGHLSDDMRKVSRQNLWYNPEPGSLRVMKQSQTHAD